MGHLSPHTNQRTAIGLSLSAVAFLSWLLYLNSRPSSTAPGTDGAGLAGEPLIFYCAAGIKPPVEEAVAAFTVECGIPVRLQYAGSGTLLSNIEVTGTGDLYIAGDNSFIDTARQKRLVAETIPLAGLRPVIAVAKGNPKRISGPRDLLRDDVRVALGNPGAAAVGERTKKALTSLGLWASTEQAVKARGVFKPTVNEVANDVKIGTVDAGIVWDATVRQYPELESACPLSNRESHAAQVTVGILVGSTRPTQALRLARFLSAPTRGGTFLSRHGYIPATGDPWSESPEILLLSGGVNRPAIEETLRAFERREGCRVTRVYNGCGILVAQMKAGERPDAYFACDASFMGQVRDLFLDACDISETDIIIAVPKGNPRSIESLRDLASTGMKVGAANPKQSALGALTVRMLSDAGLLEAVMANVRSQTPTADLLVNQLRTETLDAVIVYEANVAHVREHLDLVRIDLPSAKAVQPFAVSRDTKYPLLTQRLLSAIRSVDSRRRYLGSGFRWLADEATGATE